jgi:hypothetical protein
MNLEQLIEEARALVRPCVHLLQDSTDAPLAAVWGGSGLVANSSDESASRHWMSLDCRFLPEGYEGLAGCLSIYLDDDEEHGIVAIDRALQLGLSAAISGTALFAHPSSSWPPIDALFKFGSPAIKNWIAECGWPADMPYHGGFKDHEIVNAYENHVRPLNPLFGEIEGVFAMLGGWHDAWPENDWFDLLDKKLVAYTFEEAEPWVEVWVDGGQNFQVIQRIS